MPRQNMDPSAKKHLALSVALCVAIVALALMLVLFFRQYQHIQRLDYVSHERQSFFQSLHGSGPLTGAEAGSVQVWMTFEYVDRAFSLPPAYLQASLDITDSRFPRITVAEYAKDAGLSDAAALSKVQAAVSAYFVAR